MRDATSAVDRLLPRIVKLSEVETPSIAWQSSPCVVQSMCMHTMDSDVRRTHSLSIHIPHTYTYTYTHTHTHTHAQVERIFQHFDTDGNGEMDRHEFKKMLREARVLTGVNDVTFSRMARRRTYVGAFTTPTRSQLGCLYVCGRGCWAPIERAHAYRFTTNVFCPARNARTVASNGRYRYLFG